MEKSKDLREVLEGYDVEVLDEIRTFNIIGEIDDELVTSFANWKDNLSELESPITLRIHSPGGYLSSMCAMIGLMEDFNEIHGEVIGDCFSAALGIFASCHKRSMKKYATCMFHVLSYDMSGNKNEHKEQIRRANIAQNKYEEIIMSASFLKKNDFKRSKDWYLNRYECIKIGLINN